MDYGVSVGFHRASEYKIGVVDNIIPSPWSGWHIYCNSPEVIDIDPLHLPLFIIAT